MNQRRNPGDDIGPVVEEYAGCNAGKGTGGKGNKRVPLPFRPLPFFIGFALGFLLSHVIIKILTQFL